MNRTIARVMAFLAAILWGTSFVIIRWGLLFVPALQFVLLRFLFASLIIIIILSKNGQLRGVLNVLTSKSVIIASIFNALGYIFQFLGQQYTRATNASLLINLSGVFVAVLAHFLLKEKLSTLGEIGVTAAFVGASLLITKGDIAGFFSLYFLGDFLCLLAGFFWAIYIVESKKITEKKFNDLQLLAAWFLYTTIFSAPLAIYQGIVFLTIEAILAILYTAVFCTVIAFLFWFGSLKGLEATTSSIYFIIEVIISAILEQIIFGLNLTFIEIFGACLAVIGVIITDISFSKRL